MKKMNKKKRIILIVLIAALVLAAGTGGVLLLRKNASGSVNVYAMSDVSMSDYWGDTLESYGQVTTDRVQSVYASATQQITEVYVEEGQPVSVGDKILAYDTTLTDIELERAEIEVKKQEVQLTKARQELANIKAMKPYVPVVTPAPTPKVNTPTETPHLCGGNGTAGNPYIYLWSDGADITESFINGLFGSQGARTAENGDDNPPAASSSIYVVFVVRENNSLTGDVISAQGIKFTRGSAGDSFSMFEANLPDDGGSDEPDTPSDDSSGYTAAEIAKMRAEKEAEIKNLDVTLRVAKVELQQKKSEISDGVVKSTIDGVVKTVNDASTAYDNNEPVVVISGGGGYYVQASVGELNLDDIKIGQTVTVNSWENYTQVTGEIVEISEYPTTQTSYSDGNSNVSYYPFKVFVDESANLKEYEYVSVQYSSNTETENGSSFYLDKMFILDESGKKYVYIRNEDGKLEKVQLKTGKNVWGQYTEILGGLTMEDYIAFPYGKDVKDGAKTEEATLDQLYNGY